MIILFNILSFDTLLKAAQRLLTMINAQEDGKEEKIIGSKFTETYAYTITGTGNSFYYAKMTLSGKDAAGTHRTGTWVRQLPAR